LIAGKQESEGRSGADRQPDTAVSSPNANKIITLVKWSFSLILLAWGLWYVSREITVADITQALATARVGYIALAFAIILATMAAKAWRWQQLFYPRRTAPAFIPLFWAVSLGQFVNTTVPFLRLGDLARVHTLYRQTGMGRIRSLSTLVLEKTLDMIMLALTTAVLLPLVIIPEYVVARGVTLGTAAGLALLLLYLFAYQAEWVIGLAQRMARYLPEPLARPILKLVTASLEGLGALRAPRQALVVLGASALIALLSILTPWMLLYALRLPFGQIEATLIHIGAVAASAVPAPTPARIGVFEFAVVFMLRQFGLQDEALALSYAILFHLVVILPQIVLGALAASQTRWRWRMILGYRRAPIEGEPEVVEP
jgi:uncharacterized protein (TIRG00374 family)